MKRYQRYLAQFLIATLSMCSALVAADLLLLQSEPAARLASALDAVAVDILYLGDSTAYATSQCVPERHAIDGWLRRFTNRTILSIHRNGNSPIVWSDYVEAMSSRRHKPRLLLFPINLRSFSGAWFTDPTYQWKLDRLRARARYGNFSSEDLLDYLRARFTDEIADDVANWKQQPVSYAGRDLGPRQELMDAVSIPGTGAIECTPGLEDAYAEELGLLFQYHYTNVIEPSHPMFAFIGDTVTSARRQGIEVLVYLTPVNVEDGVKWVGAEFRQQVESNTAVIREFLEQQQIDFLDLSGELGRERFIDRRYACEHLDQQGRRFVARKLADQIEARLE